MGQKRPLVFLGVAVGIALVTTILVYQWLQGQKVTEVEPAVVEVEGVGVAVASNDIPWGTPLTEDVVRIVHYPEESIPAGHFSDEDTHNAHSQTSCTDTNMDEF